MLRRTCAKLRVSPYSLFLVKTKAFPELQGLTLPDRARKLASLYRTLSKEDMAKLVAQASRATSFPPRVRKARKANEYSLFVKANFHKFSGTVPERIKKIAVLWKEVRAKNFER